MVQERGEQQSLKGSHFVTEVTLELRVKQTRGSILVESITRNFAAGVRRSASVGGDDYIGDARRFNGCLHIMCSQDMSALKDESRLRCKISIKPVCSNRIFSVVRQHSTDE